MVSASGLLRSEAIFAIDLHEAIPTLDVSPVESRIARLMLSPISRGSPSSRRAPVQSRKASSMLSCSTSGEKPASTDITIRETSQ